MCVFVLSKTPKVRENVRVISSEVLLLSVPCGMHLCAGGKSAECKVARAVRMEFDSVSGATEVAVEAAAVAVARKRAQTTAQAGQCSAMSTS